jgi:hypothetical protein
LFQRAHGQAVVIDDENLHPVNEWVRNHCA